MSTTSTFSFALDASPAPTDWLAGRNGFFAKLVETRMRRGEEHVAAFLKRHSDASLADLGFSPDTIRAIRATGKIPASHWR